MRMFGVAKANSCMLHIYYTRTYRIQNITRHTICLCWTGAHTIRYEERVWLPFYYYCTHATGYYDTPLSRSFIQRIHSRSHSNFLVRSPFHQNTTDTLRFPNLYSVIFSSLFSAGINNLNDGYTVFFCLKWHPDTYTLDKITTSKQTKSAAAATAITYDELPAGMKPQIGRFSNDWMKCTNKWTNEWTVNMNTLLKLNSFAGIKLSFNLNCSTEKEELCIFNQTELCIILIINTMCNVYMWNSIRCLIKNSISNKQLTCGAIIQFHLLYLDRKKEIILY